MGLLLSYAICVVIQQSLIFEEEEQWSIKVYEARIPRLVY